MTRGPRARIGYVVKMFPRLSETFIRNEILELERQGLALRIFSLKRPAAAEAGLVERMVRAPIIYLPERVYREPLRVLRALLGAWWRYPAGFLRTLLHVLRGRELRSVSRGLRRFSQACCLVHELGGVQHLHAHFASDPTRLASWVRMICAVSFSVTTHAKDLYQDHRIGSPGLRYKMSRARFVVTNSEYSRTELQASLDPEDAAKVLTIYNSVDLAAFARREKEPTEPLILSVGRLVEKKGFQDLIIACRLLKEWGVPFRCEIVGFGPLQKLLEDSIAAFGLQGTVRLSGPMPHLELRDHYLKAQVFALPCVVAANGDRDILPNVLKEAMSVGVPVVTTSLAGVAELVTHEESGLLVPAGDTEALAQALRRLLEDGGLRGRLAGHARKVMEERFDLRRNLARLRELLLDAIADAREVPAPLHAAQTPHPIQQL